MSELDQSRARLLAVLVGVQFEKIVDDIAEGRAWISSVSEADYGPGVEVTPMAVEPISLRELLGEGTS